MSDKLLVGLKQIQAFCGCGKNTLAKWLKYENFPAKKKDGTWRACPEKIKEWFQNNE